ncbi:MAG TPA: DMT family transporter [Nitrospiria bacterium]|nr:DMT family transporter [Nitrospiria bacterium]
MTRRSGMILMLLAATCIGVQAYFVKRASEYTGAAEIAFLRFLTSYLIIQTATTAGWIEIRLVNRRLVLARGILGGIGNLLYFYAIAATRLSNAMVLLYSYPIFASLYAQWLQGGAPALRIVIPLFASFAGVYLIVDPSFHRLVWGDLLGLASGMTVGGAIVSLKESRKTDSAWTIFHYFNIAGMVLSLPLVIGHWTLPPAESLGPLAGVVVFSILGQIGMTEAFRYTTTAEGSVLSMFGAVVGSVLGIWLLSEPARPGFLIGALLVVFSGIYLTLRGSDES